MARGVCWQLCEDIEYGYASEGVVTDQHTHVVLLSGCIIRVWGRGSLRLICDCCVRVLQSAWSWYGHVPVFGCGCHVV